MSDFESCTLLLIRIKGELSLLEAKIDNVTSEQPDFERPRKANFTSVCNFQAIIPGRPILRRNNWIEPNTHLMWIWEQTLILAWEMSPWLSFGLHMTRNWGWLGSVFYFEKTSGWLSLQTRPMVWCSMIMMLLFKGNQQIHVFSCPINSCLMSRQSWFYQRWIK